MRKTIRNAIGALLLTAAVVFSVLQLNSRVAYASGCPPADSVGCACMFVDGTAIIIDGNAYWYCSYLCGTCGGNGDPLYIEQTVVVPD